MAPFEDMVWEEAGYKLRVANEVGELVFHRQSYHLRCQNIHLSGSVFDPAKQA